MLLHDFISSIRLLFIKDKELYAFIHRATGIYPRNYKLYKLAMVHRSRPIKTDDGRWVNNERLEYLGDSVLDVVVAEYLYNHFPTQHEGFLTSTRAKIVQRESLNRIGEAMGIDHHVRTAYHSVSHNSYICGNAVEALVGAIYLDRGFDACRKFITKRIIEAHFTLEDLVKTDQNFKSRLIEWTQKFRVTIEYELVDTMTDENGNAVFKTAVMLGHIYAADGTGYSKKESHQNASQKALDRLNTDQNFKQQVLSTASE